MNRIVLSLVVLFTTIISFAQSNYDAREAFNPQFYPYTGNDFRSASGEPGPKYWQNRADYKINCSLDTTNHIVAGDVEITYTNNSPDNLKFLWLQKTKPNKKFLGLVYGIVPEFQGTGVDAFMIVESSYIIQPHTPYLEYEMQWIGEFNPKMVNVAETLGESFRSRTLTTYRYLFDRTKEFKPHPMLL